MTVILDTHVWVWWLLPDSPLPEKDRKALDRLASDQGICLSAISLWEVQMLHNKKRVQLPIPFATWLRRAASADMLTVLPLNADTVIAVDDLPAGFHGDPADRMIVGTARAHNLPLATRDEVIKKSRLARIWKP